MKAHRAGDGERSLAVFIDFENMGLGFNNRRDKFEIAKVLERRRRDRHRGGLRAAIDATRALPAASGTGRYRHSPRDGHSTRLSFTSNSSTDNRPFHCN